MAASEQAIFEVIVKGDQARAELERTRASAMSLGGGLGSLRTGLEAVDKAGGRSAQQGLSALSFALGGVAGRGSAVVNALGDIAGLLSGGPLVAGIAAVGIGAALLGERFDIFGTKAEAAAKKASEHFADLQKELVALDAALEAMASGTTIERIKQRAIVAERELAAKSAIEALGGAERFARLAEYEAQGIDIPTRTKRAYDEAIKATKDFALENQKLISIVRNAQFQKHLHDIEEAARAVTTVTGGKPDVIISGADLTGSGSFQAQLDASERRSQAEAALQQKTYDDKLVLQQRYLDEARAMQNADDLLRLKQYEETAANELALRQNVADIAIGITVGSLERARDAIITGQDKWLEQLAAGIFQEAGTAMIGSGIKAAAEGIALLSMGNPAGAVPAITGASLIAGGFAIGGIGTGIEHTMAGGMIGMPIMPIDQGGSRRGTGSQDRGVGGGSGGRGRGGDSNRTYVFNYGVSGPQPDDTVLAISRASKRAGSRGFTDDPAVKRGR